MEENVNWYNLTAEETAKKLETDLNTVIENVFSEIRSNKYQLEDYNNELIYKMKDYEEIPDKIWKSEIFGRSLDAIVQESIQAKLSLMPENIRFKLQQTLTKLVNKGSGNLFAIVL